VYLVVQSDCSVTSFDAHLTKAVGTAVKIKLNILGQTAASRCKGLPVYFYQATSNTLKMGTGSLPERSEKLHIFCGCLPEKLSLNSVAAKPSRLLSVTVSCVLYVNNRSNFCFLLSALLCTDYIGFVSKFIRV
jgi:hypothetical protein